MVEFERPLYFLLSFIAVIWFYSALHVHVLHTCSYAQLAGKAMAIVTGESQPTSMKPIALVENESRCSLLAILNGADLTRDPLGLQIIFILKHPFYNSLPVLADENVLHEYWLKGKMSTRPILKWLTLAETYLRGMEWIYTAPPQVYYMDAYTMTIYRELMEWIRTHPHQKTFTIIQ